jgi:hypothetical protein
MALHEQALPRAEEEEPAPRTAPDIGHYFDQSVFDLQYTLLMAQARRLALEADLAAQGITVDPVTGEVTLTAPSEP